MRRYDDEYGRSGLLDATERFMEYFFAAAGVLMAVMALSFI